MGICPNCGDVVFASKDACKMCGTSKPPGAGISEEEATYTPQVGKGKGKWRAGDWECPNCKKVNFSSRTECMACGTPRPADQMRLGMKPGDWVCTSCGDLVFASKDNCKMCGTAWSQEAVMAPKGEGKGYRDRPY